MTPSGRSRAGPRWSPRACPASRGPEGRGRGRPRRPARRPGARGGPQRAGAGRPPAHREGHGGGGRRRLGAGESQLIAPDAIAPGAVAVGFVFFRTPPPAGATLRFRVEQGPLDPAGIEAVDLPLEVAPLAGGRAAATIRNPGPRAVGFVTATAVCFDAAGALVDGRTFPTDEAQLDPGATRPVELVLDPRCTGVAALAQGVVFSTAP